MTHRVVYWKQNKRKNKYNAKGTEYGGKWYHSAKEAKYAEDLDWRVKAGEIEKWSGQFKLRLFMDDHFLCNYYMDFKEWHTNGDIVYTEVKGFETELWRLKWKITEALWPNIEGVEEHAQLQIVK